VLDLDKAVAAPLLAAGAVWGDTPKAIAADCPVSGGCHRAATGNFTMDLVLKDIGLFQALADTLDVPLDISLQLIRIFEDGQARYGAREWSPNIIKRLEEACGTTILAPGFPAEMVDDEPEAAGYEIKPKSRSH